MTSQLRHERIYAAWLLLGLGLVALGGRVIWLHTMAPDPVRPGGKTKGDITMELLSQRGRILDGSAVQNVLALSVTVQNLCADPTIVATNRVKPPKAAAAALAPILVVDPEELGRQLAQTNTEFVLLQRNLSEEKLKAVKDLKIPGVFTQETTLRKYPLGSFLCHVIGFVNAEGIGSAGVEQSMERFLRGSPGLLQSKKDGRGREIYDFRSLDVAAQEGADVILTIDQNIQYMAEKALDRLMEMHRARGAWVAVERVRTGEILALASRPGYTPSDYRTSTPEMMRNRAIGYIYEPGSAFKPAVIAAALNEKLIKPETILHCENGRWLYQKRYLRDYHPYGPLTVADIIKKSSNIGAAKIALLLGNQRLDRYLREFGIGRQLGVDLPGEQVGIFHPVAQWTGISPTRIAMGQGVGVTALQMLGVVSAIANDGFLMKPHLVKKVVAKNGAVLYEASPVVLSRPINGETAAIMRQILTRVTEEGGTGVRAAVEGYRVAGKTGSAQKPVDGRYSETDYWATFAGFLPAENPEIAIIVTVDEPQPIHLGGVVAAPAFGEIAEQAARYLNIPSPACALADM